MQFIKKLKLINFKRFSEIEIEFSEETNVLIGDNEVGKSSVLQAIELVARGSRHKVESIGIESLLNKGAVTKFFTADKTIDALPEIHVEVYLGNDDNPDLVGRHNSEKTNLSGLHMICQPNEELAGEINDILATDEDNFPFEYYIVKFITFNGEPYSGYRQFLKCLFVDSSQINSEYANKEYIKSVYESTVDQPNRFRLKNEYRQGKAQFKENSLSEINETIVPYAFTVRSDSKTNLETDLTLLQDDIPLDERGKGQQCFIKTEFALTRHNENQLTDTLLLEEPENHLSHVNMKRLISKIAESHQKQIIIATHSSLISARLDMRNAILLGESNESPLKLNDLTDSTAKFFMKAPDNNLLEFVLSKKVILVEGDAEFMLMEALYNKHSGSTLEQDGIHVISVGGTSFKRYMEVAKILNVKTAVIRDNDRDYQANCIDNYNDHVSDEIRVFSDEDNDRYTFEVCLYNDNQAICDDLFSGGRIRKAPQEFMLDNKAESALRLAEAHADDLEVPLYIQQAIEWIKA